MKLKFYIQIITLICFIYGCKQKEKSNAISNKTCIETVIKIDDSLGKLRNLECKKVPLSQTIAKYTNSLNNLDFKHCPERFKTAFKQHEQAWRNMIVLTDEYPELRGEMHDLFDMIKAGKDSTVFKPLLKSIWDTWAVIEKEME